MGSDAHIMQLGTKKELETEKKHKKSEELKKQGDRSNAYVSLSPSFARRAPRRIWSV